jgi:hypothetical protein
VQTPPSDGEKSNGNVRHPHGAENCRRRRPGFDGAHIPTIHRHGLELFLETHRLQTVTQWRVMPRKQA